jgi:hypothetical protein
VSAAPPEGAEEARHGGHDVVRLRCRTVTLSP